MRSLFLILPALSMWTLNPTNACAQAPLVFEIGEGMPSESGTLEDSGRAIGPEPESSELAAEAESEEAKPERFLKRGRQAAIDEAAEIYRVSGEARIIKRQDDIVFPFGESEPVVRCSPLRACDIELQEGELIRDVALGDSERWIAKPLASGDVESSVPHVIIKPKDYGLQTNLVIGTTRRTYHLALVSPPEGKKAAYDRHVSFYYPDDWVESWTSEQQLRRLEVKRLKSVAATRHELAALTLSDLNFEYSIKAGRKIDWAPQSVFDDGEHVYIQFPSSVRSGDLPALLVKVEGGAMALSNYRVQGLWYVVDGLFSEAELVVGVGRSRRSVELRNLRTQTGG